MRAPRISFGSAVLTAARSGNRGHKDKSSMVTEGMASYLINTMHKLPPRDIAMAVYGFSLVPQTINFPSIVDKVTELSAPWLRNFSGQDICMLLLAMKSEETTSSLLISRLSEELLWKMEDCSPVELSTLPRCVPKTPEGEQVIIHLLHRMLDYIAEGSVESRHIAAILHGLAKRGHPADQLHRYAEQALEHAEKHNLVEPMNPIDMAQLCFAIGRAGANGENMREALTSIASSLIEHQPALQQHQALVIAEAFRRARMHNEEFDSYLKEHL